MSESERSGAPFRIPTEFPPWSGEPERPEDSSSSPGALADRPAVPRPLAASLAVFLGLGSGVASLLMLAGSGSAPGLILGVAIVLGVTICVGAFRLFVTPRAHFSDYAPAPRRNIRAPEAERASDSDGLEEGETVWPVVVWWACTVIGVGSGAWLVTSMVRGGAGSWWQAFERLGPVGAFWGGVIGAGFGLAAAVLMWTVKPRHASTRRQPGT